MEFYSLPYYHKKNLTYMNPNQLHNYNYNQNIAGGVSISPIKPHSYNYDKIKNTDKNFRIYNNNIDNISMNRNYKNLSSDIDSKSVDLNHNIKTRDKQRLRSSNSYSNVFVVNKNIKRYNNFFNYSNSNNNVNTNDYIVKDDFWTNNNKNNPTSNLLAKNRSSSFFEERNKNNNNNRPQFITNEKYIYNDNLVSNNEDIIINKRLNNNRSFSSYKSLNNKNFKYLFDFSSENNNNNSNNVLNRDLNDNNLSLHDRYISPEYNLLKPNYFYKDNKSQQLVKSLNKFEIYFNNYKNMNNQMIKSIKNSISNNPNGNEMNSFNSNNVNTNSVNFNNKNLEKLNKNDSNYKENLLNYILNNSEIFKKIIDNAFLSKNNNINNPYLLKNNNANINDIMQGYYLPQKTKENMNKKTLLLDLDETLVHSSFKPLPINSDIHFNIIYQNKPHMINVLIRPFVYEFLLKMSKLYEIVIFTASVPQYANPLLNILDKNKCITHRLFRQHCISLYGLFIKDLRRIGRDLKETILLDNNPISYLVNQDNGLPIKTWHSNKNDQELIKIIPLLEYLAKIEINDVREILKKVVVNNMVDYNLVNKIIYGNNNNNSFNKTNLSHANSFKNIDNIRNNKISNENRNKFFTPKKSNSNNILINNYNKNESYNKANNTNNNNININIINFNISKLLYLNEDIKHNSNPNNNYHSNKIRNNIPISKKPKKNKNEKKLNNIIEPNNKKSKEDIELIINSKYKYLGHIINNKKQHKNIKIFNKEMDNSKRNFSHKDIFSSKANQINKNNVNNMNQINKNYFQEIPYRKTSNNASRENINYVYNNFLIDDLNKNKINEIKNNNNNKMSLLKNFSYFNSDQINNNINNQNINYNNKFHQRASTPSVINHHFNIIKNNNNNNNNYMYKDYINHNSNIKEIYKYT